MSSLPDSTPMGSGGVVCWAVIPARWASSRLPGKPLADLCGRPLVEHVWRRTVAAGVFARVLVATDDDRVEAAVRGFGGEVVRTGPAPSGTHRVHLAVGDARPAVVVNVQGDQPLVPSEHLRQVVRGVCDGAEVCTLAAPWPVEVPLDDPHRVKVTLEPVDFSRRPLPGARLHVGTYAFTPEALGRCAAAPSSRRSRDEDLEQLAWLDAGLTIAVREVGEGSPGVDTAEQLIALRRQMIRDEA